jgi:hypothetical protein
VRDSKPRLDNDAKRPEYGWVRAFCESCGFKPDAPSFLRRERIGLFRRRANVCPACQPPAADELDRRTGKYIRSVQLLMAVVAFIALITGEGRNGLLLVATFEAWTLSGPFSTLVHEIGHTLAGRAIGWRLRVLRVGRGRLLASFPLFAHDRPPLVDRRRAALLALGGPLANLLLASALAALAWAWGSRTRDGGSEFGLAILTGAMLSQASMALRTLYPSRKLEDNLVTDGRLLLQILRTQTSTGDVHDVEARAQARLSEGNLAAAATAFAEAADLSPANPQLLSTLLHCIAHHDGPKAAAKVAEDRRSEIEAASNVEDPATPWLLANVAWVLARGGGNLDFGNACSQRALELAPELSAALGARGTVLAALGDGAAARPFLMRGLTASLSDQDRADHCTVLAEIERSDGDPAWAQAYEALGRYLLERA